MGTCVPTQALLSGLIRRIREEGHVPARSDLEALIALGLSHEVLTASFATLEGDAGRSARAVLASLAR
jgi:hypothetical protein